MGFQAMELPERMQKTVKGQVTWAKPELGKTCAQCKWRTKHPKPKLAPRVEDQCRLVFVHSKKPGVPFNANTAIACSMFEA